MTSSIVECIPNFSEGRRMEVVEAILEAITAVEGITLLDHSSDSDHNRTVVTFVGSPQAVEDAAFAGIAKAAELIDLDKHQGEHPRMGATDVVPFVPISGVKMAECIEIARRVAKRVGEELNIPVYLYEKAASRPDRENLAVIRKGEYELLKEEIGHNPDRDPDFGPTEVGPAGATAIGARSPLIAWNVYLNTDDVDVAQKIGKAVRHLSGGLRFVKGLGMLIEGKAQVSMNLTNFKRTPIHRVLEIIRSEAKRYGVQVTHSELIGLIPQQALTNAAVWYLQLDDFDPEQVLEVRMQTAQSDQENAGPGVDVDFLDDLASSSPTPGGGSAAAYAAAMAAGLVAMVGRVTVNKKKYKDVEDQIWPMIEQADALRAQLTDAVQNDAESYEAVMAARKLPKASAEDKAARLDAIQQTTLIATKVPLSVVEMASQVMELAVTAAQLGNINAITDAGTAAALARSAFTGAGLNVRINLGDLDDKGVTADIEKQLSALEKKAAKIEPKIQTALKERGGL